jgi:hypothetical protein
MRARALLPALIAALVLGPAADGGATPMLNATYVRKPLSW